MVVTEGQKKRLRAWFEKRLGTEMDKFDFDALCNCTLTYGENKNILVQKAGEMFPDIVLEKRTKKDMDEQEERYDVQSMQHYEADIKQAWDSFCETLKAQRITELDGYYSAYYSHIENFIENKKMSGLAVVGAGGMGKSMNLYTKLGELGYSTKKGNLEILKGHVTACAFYRMLYELSQREGDVVLVIDDVVKLIQDKDIIALLLGAADFDNRRIEWMSRSQLTKDIPASFIWNKKIVILANEMKLNGEFLAALKDRCNYYRLSFTKEQIIEMLYIIANKNSYPAAMVDWLKEISDKVVIGNLSLRLMHKIHTYYGKPDWRDRVMELLEVDKLKTAVYKTMKEGRPLADSIREFIEMTGRSERLYYMLKAEMTHKVQHHCKTATA